MEPDPIAHMTSFWGPDLPWAGHSGARALQVLPPGTPHRNHRLHLSTKPQGREGEQKRSPLEGHVPGEGSWLRAQQVQRSGSRTGLGQILTTTITPNPVGCSPQSGAKMSPVLAGPHHSRVGLRGGGGGSSVKRARRPSGHREGLCRPTKWTPNPDPQWINRNTRPEPH